MTTAMTLSVDQLFSLANFSALLAWAALVTLPRWRLLRRGIQGLVVLGLCLLYTVLIQLHFFSVQGVGFFSLAAVRRLFSSPEVALAGWVHYLAFDLFVGLWIAQQADERGISRWLQAPILVTTFMFGPIGLLMYAVATGVQHWLGARAPVGPEVPA